MPKVYIASWFASKDEMKKKAEELRANGIEVTSRWLEEKVAGTVQIKDVEDDYLRETAQFDIEDILQANVVVLNVPSAEDLKKPDVPISSWARGGRHFEAGFQYATMLFYWCLPDLIRDRGNRYLILVGHKENVFHFLDSIEKNKYADSIRLPVIHTYETWDAAQKALVASATDEEITKKEHETLTSYGIIA